jgi:hypothetical protein
VFKSKAWPNFSYTYKFCSCSTTPLLDIELQQILLCLLCLLFALMFHQSISFGSKQPRLLINCDAHLSFDIMKHPISGKNIFKPREFCNPFKLKFSCVIIWPFQLWRQKNRQEIKNAQNNNILKDAGELTWVLTWAHELSLVAKMMETKGLH